MHRRTYSASGPDYVWHVDGNDKLMPYGFGISGAIDGFSRHLKWLQVNTTNKDPAVIAGYFFNALKSTSGCPTLLRMDAGAENSIIKDMQDALVGNGRNGSNKTYIVATSTLNQRIESFWAHLRKQCLEYWICMFHDLKERGYFTGDYLDQSLLRICFIGLLQVGIL